MGETSHWYRPVLDAWHQNSDDYTVRVRGTVYLWGSAGITANMTFPTPLLLHIRNDRFGELIDLGADTVNGSPTTLGVLQAGEQITIPIQGLSGVTATCALDSTAFCAVRRG